MTRRAAGIATLLLLAAAWAAAAYFLWQSKVPSSLQLPHVDTAKTYPASVLANVESFDHGESLLFLGGIAVELVVFALYAWRGAGFARESSAGPVGTGLLLGMLGFALLWLAEVPFAVLEVWWERRHGVSHTSYLDATLGGWLQLGAKFLLLCVALAIVMGFARLVGNWWWIPAAPVFVGLLFVRAFITPYLVVTHPLRDPVLLRTIAELERTEHVGHVPAEVENVSTLTSLPNAEAAGIGPSRRIILWDTLLDGRFSPGQVRVVIAHEFGHVQRNHVLKEVGWYALFTIPEALLIAVVVRRRGGMAEPAAVPLAVFVFVVFGLLALPLQQAVSRHMEAEADWIALQTTHDPSDMQSLFEAFVPIALDDPNPPTWEYLLEANHPTINQRVAMARAWKARYATSTAAAHIP
ncbi:MAG TPA: M48 family metalloprotease [Gaiellaceae bacterium]|nr:M48 family metalloprotease [Gaiellaceae bacterium]